MSKPLLERLNAKAQAAKFHRAVMKAWGHTCWFCGKHATDAGHVIPRNKLGRQRYCDPEIARPLCRVCHIAQTNGDLDFSLAVQLAAIKVANQYLRVKI